MEQFGKLTYEKNILAIETSCDETAISIIEAFGGVKKPSFRVLANVVHSQVDLHKQYGGVFPALAKREHSKIWCRCSKRHCENRVF